MTDEEVKVIEKVLAWRRAQKTRQAAPADQKQAAKAAEYHALRKLGNAADSLGKQREVGKRQSAPNNDN